MENVELNRILKDLTLLNASIYKEWISVISFWEEFAENCAKERLHLPYHLNIIDELHINENGHSRILFKLLAYVNESEDYQILESLIEFIKRKPRSEEFDKVIFKDPNITQEKKRIDLWVRDYSTGVALIFENKVYNAVDQDAQISRYIKSTKDCGFKDNKIFIIYLPQTSDKEPDPQSWGDFKEQYSGRYINLSFRDGILPWLEKYVLPNLNEKDIYLKSAVEQYIDYLHGLFMSRTIYKQMNMNLQKIMTEHYKLDECSNDEQRIEKIDEKLNEINEVWNQLSSMKVQLREKLDQSHCKEWEDKLKEKYPEPYADFQQQNDDRFAGVVLLVQDKKVLISIGKEKGQLYCQFEFVKDLKVVGSRIGKALEKILPTHYPDGKCIWKYFPENDYDEVFQCLMDVIEVCTKQ